LPNFPGNGSHQDEMIDDQQNQQENKGIHCKQD
jgi:hypothetical protein